MYLILNRSQTKWSKKHKSCEQRNKASLSNLKQFKTGKKYTNIQQDFELKQQMDIRWSAVSNNLLISNTSK